MKLRFLKVSQPFLAVALVLAILAPASASTIAYESFNYTLGGDLNGKGLADAGFSGAWAGGTSWDVASGSLSYPSSGVSLTSKGNKAAIDAGGGDIGLSLGSPIDFDVDNTYYVSFLLNKTNNGDSSDYFWVLLRGDGQSSNNTKVGFGVSSAENPLITLNDTNSNTAAGSGVTGDCFYLGKIVTHATGNDQIFLQVYNSTGTVPSSEPSWGYSNSAVVTGTASSLNLWAGSNTKVSVDEIRLGTSFTDVVSTIPEPSTLVLCGAGMLGLLAYAWRKRK